MCIQFFIQFQKWQDFLLQFATCTAYESKLRSLERGTHRKSSIIYQYLQLFETVKTRNHGSLRVVSLDSGVLQNK
jgi:hypothetical protein